MNEPIHHHLNFDIRVIPVLNADGYGVLMSAWVNPEDKQHHHSLGNVPLDKLADWVASNVRTHILARQDEMQAGKAKYLAATPHE